MSDTLEWYAKRGLLASSDEPEAQNVRRLAIGRKIARLAMTTGNSNLVGAYTARAGTGGQRWEGLTAVEREVASRQALDDVMQLLPPRTREAVIRVCVEDQPVGKPLMERLRCGLDVEIQKNTNCEKMH